MSAMAARPKRRAWLDHAVSTWSEFTQDGGSRLSAALAYYILFAIAPALVLLAAFGTRALGALEPGGALFESLSELLGPELGGYVRDIAVSAAEARASTAAAGTLGFIVLFWAIGVFYVNMQFVFNKMWRVQVKPGADHRTVFLTRVRRFSVMLIPVAALAVTAVVAAIAGLLRRVVAAGLLGGLLEQVLRVLQSPFTVFLLA